MKASSAGYCGTTLVALCVLIAALGTGCSKASYEREERAATTPPATPPQAALVSEKGREFIRGYHPLLLRPCDGEAGNPLKQWQKGATIGYGHAIVEQEWAQFENGISEDKAKELFDADLERVARRVKSLIRVEVPQHQFDALVSLAFNIGCKAFEDSSVLKLINDPEAKTPFRDLESAWKAWNTSPATSKAGAPVPVTPERLFGTYVATGYAWCSWSPRDEDEAWMREHLRDKAIILADQFSLRSITIHNPRYEIREYPALVEGDVPVGVRRRLSDFLGAGEDRRVITVLEVYEPGAANPRCDVEVIDRDTLWDTWNGPWIFEWRRDGSGNSTIPLKDRVIGGARSGD